MVKQNIMSLNYITSQSPYYNNYYIFIVSIIINQKYIKILLKLQKKTFNKALYRIK